MAKLRADKRNYKKAFTVHANSYDNWNIVQIMLKRNASSATAELLFHF